MAIDKVRLGPGVGTARGVQIPPPTQQTDAILTLAPSRFRRDVSRSAAGQMRDSGRG
jgi:hypothetical protein